MHTHRSRERKNQRERDGKTHTNTHTKTPTNDAHKLGQRERERHGGRGGLLQAEHGDQAEAAAAKVALQSAVRTEGAAKAAVAAMTMLQPDAVDSTRGAVLQAWSAAA